ncbi:MAG: alpha/beta fold hydrolase, partial [Paracoccaceae bacterium]
STGQGVPVLCLAGLTRNGMDFDFLTPHLTGYKVITADYRGRGFSDYDPNYMNYNVVREALDVVELLDHLGIERAALVGTSRGGLVAMALATTHKHRMTGVVLNDVGPVIEQQAIARIMEYVGQSPVSASYNAAAAAMQHVMNAQFPDVTLDRWQQVVKAQYEESPVGLSLRYDPKLRDALVAQAAAGAAPDLWPMFLALEGVPTGLIRGENSDLLSAQTMADMQSRMPDMHSVTVPDRGHVPFLDEAPALTLINTILEASK